MKNRAIQLASSNDSGVVQTGAGRAQWMDLRSRGSSARARGYMGRLRTMIRTPANTAVFGYPPVNSRHVTSAAESPARSICGT
jgi:hypothetical protein